jgi:hypothetical protein
MSRLAYDPEFDDDWGKGAHDEIGNEDSVLEIDASTTRKLKAAIEDDGSKADNARRSPSGLSFSSTLY